MASDRYKSAAQLEQERREQLLRVLRQVSAEAAERWPRVRAKDRAAETDFRSRRLAELLAEERDDV